MKPRSCSAASGNTAVLLLSLCFFCSSMLATSQTTDSCSSTTSLAAVSGLIPFDTSNLTCFDAWTSQGFIVRFGKAATASNAWSFVLSAPDSGGYISIGFSPTGRMVGSSAVAGWATSAGGAGSARRYYLGGTSSRACPPDQGKLTLARAPTVVAKASLLYLAFQLAGQPLTDVVYAVGPRGSLPGSGGFLPQHQDMAAGTISLSGGSPATGGGGDDDDDDDDGEDDDEGRKGKKSKDSEEGRGDDDDASPASATSTGTTSGGLSSKRRHGVLAAVSWGAVVPAGAALARFLKRHDPLWFYAHVAAQGLGSVLGAAAIVTGFKLDDADEGGPVATHKDIGIAVLVGACLQATALLARPAKETKARRYWNWFHHGVGRAAIVLGVANVLYGLSLASERQEWSYVYGIIIGVFAVVCLVLEEWRRRQ